MYSNKHRTKLITHFFLYANGRFDERSSSLHVIRLSDVSDHMQVHKLVIFTADDTAAFYLATFLSSMIRLMLLN